MEEWSFRMGLPVSKPGCRRFLRTVFNGKTLSPDASNPALTLTWLMNRSTAYNRSVGIRIVIYLENNLILHQKLNVQQSHPKADRLSRRMGFLVNLKTFSSLAQQRSPSAHFSGDYAQRSNIFSVHAKSKAVCTFPKGTFPQGKCTIEVLLALLGRMTISERQMAGTCALHRFTQSM